MTLTRPVANFGVAITSGRPGIEPRIVVGGDESHLVGYPGLPVDINPYTSRFGDDVRVAAAIRPAPGTYDVVFDTAGRPGPFTFRYWVDDVSPPTLRLATPRPKQGGTAVVVARDASSGVDPASIAVRVDSARIKARYDQRTSRITFSLGGLNRGPHRLVVTAADYEETKNMENVPLILPNTAVLQLVEVAANGVRELVALGLDEPEVRLLLRTRLAAPCVAAEARPEPRPFGPHHERDRKRQQNDREHAHALILAPRPNSSRRVEGTTRIGRSGSPVGG